MGLRNEEPIYSVPDKHRGASSTARLDTHPAFGVAVVTRSSGSSRTLFQSDLQHHETITLRIETAERVRDLNRDWVHPRTTLLEVEMSLAQWGSLVSSIGIGSGVPVTIRRTESEPFVPAIPYAPRIAESVDEVKGAVSKILGRARASLAELTDAIENKKGVRAIREALHNHSLSIAHAEGSAAFAVTSLTKAAENVTSQAKSDIEAHILAASALTGTPAPVALPDHIGPKEITQ